MVRTFCFARRFAVKSFFPRLVVVLSLLVFSCLAYAQSPSAQPASTGGSDQASLPDLIRRVKPSVVSVLTYDAKGEPLISGSGFFIRPGQVVTNVHVIQGAHRVEIHTLEGKGRTYPVTGALALDEEADLALLNVDMPAERSHPLKFADGLPE